jgi:hypothetical protein
VIKLTTIMSIDEPKTAGSASAPTSGAPARPEHYFSCPDFSCPALIAPTPDDAALMISRRQRLRRDFVVTVAFRERKPADVGGRSFGRKRVPVGTPSQTSDDSVLVAKGELRGYVISFFVGNRTDDF